MLIITCSRSSKLFDAEAGVEGLDSERAAAFVPKHDETPDADIVGGQELRPTLSQEWAVGVPAHLHAPDLAERAHNEGHSPVRPLAACSDVEAAGELLGDALQDTE